MGAAQQTPHSRAGRVSQSEKSGDPGLAGAGIRSRGQSRMDAEGDPPSPAPPPCHNRMMPPSHPVGGGLSHHCTAQGKFLLRQTAPKQHFE